MVLFVTMIISCSYLVLFDNHDFFHSITLSHLAIKIFSWFIIVTLPIIIFSWFFMVTFSSHNLFMVYHGHFYQSWYIHGLSWSLLAVIIFSWFSMSLLGVFCIFIVCYHDNGILYHCENCLHMIWNIMILHPNRQCYTSDGCETKPWLDNHLCGAVTGTQC